MSLRRTKLRDIKKIIAEYTKPGDPETKPEDWYKFRGVAVVTDGEGYEEMREVHWYYADNIGKVGFKFPNNPKQR